MKSVHDPLYIEFLTRLRLKRKQCELTQQELSQKLGKHQSYISKIELGDRRIDLIETLQICQAMDIKLSHLIPPELQEIL